MKDKAEVLKEIRDDLRRDGSVAMPFFVETEGDDSLSALQSNIDYLAEQMTHTNNALHRLIDLMIDEPCGDGQYRTDQAVTQHADGSNQKVYRRRYYREKDTDPWMEFDVT